MKVTELEKSAFGQNVLGCLDAREIDKLESWQITSFKDEIFLHLKER
jgi:hypothetical protein